MAGKDPIESTSTTSSGLGYDLLGNLQQFNTEGDYNTAGPWSITSANNGVFSLQNGFDTTTLYNVGSSNSVLLGSMANQVAGEGFGYVPETGNLYTLQPSGNTNAGAGFLPTHISGEPITAFGAFSYNNTPVGIFSTESGTVSLYDLTAAQELFGGPIKLNGLEDVLDIDAFQSGPGNAYSIAVIGKDSNDLTALNTYIIPEAATSAMLLGAGAAAMFLRSRK